MDPELQEEAARRWEELVASGVPGDQARAQVDEWLSHRAQAARFKSEADQYASEAGSIVDVEDRNLLGDMVRASLSGVTLGGADELGAAVRALPRLMPGGQSFGEAYEEGRDAFRAARGEFREEHPILATGTEIAGAAVPAIASLPASAAKAGVTGAAKIGTGRVLATGAAEGAVAGGLESEGGMLERLGDALKGGGLGLATAGAMTGAGRVLRPIGRRALDVSGARPRSPNAVTSALGIDSVEDRAGQRIADALPDDTRAAREMLEGSSRPMTLMDVDENVAGVARAARGVQGPAKTSLPEYVTQRASLQEGRVIEDALRLSGAGPRASVLETAEEVVARRASEAEPLYRAAYQRDLPVDVLGDLAEDEAFADAYARGVRIARREGVGLPALEWVREKGARIPVQALDYAKRGLDDAIESASRSRAGMGRQESRALRNQVRNLLERVDEIVPEYGQARASYAGNSELLEALEHGRKLYRMEPDDASALVRGMSDGEREMFVRGGLEAMFQKIEDSASHFDLTRRRPLADRTRDTQRLRLLFPNDEAFEAFRAGVAEEARMAQTHRFVTGGSNTAEKLMEMAELAGVNLSSLTSGGMTGIAAQMANSALRRRSQGFTSDLGEALTPLLTAEGDDAVRLMGRLVRSSDEAAARQGRRSAVVGGASGAAAGSAAGSRRERDR